MTGPEHYAAAEKLLGDRNIDLPGVMAAAQAHATLALAAATALSGTAWHDEQAWRRVAAPGHGPA